MFIVHGPFLDIIFTSGGTEANNMVLHSVVREFHSERTLRGETALGGDTALRGETLEDSGGEGRHACLGRPHIITSNLEHDSVSLVLKNMETRGEAGEWLLEREAGEWLLEKVSLYWLQE